MVGSDLGEGHTDTRVWVGKTYGRSMEFPNRENGPYEGILVRGSNKDLEKHNLLDTSGKKINTGVCIL